MKASGEKRLLELNELDEIRLDSYKSSKIYKERTRRWHDKLIRKKEFSVGDKVLLFNSRYKLFPGKFKSRWFGPYRIHKGFDDGHLELVDNQGDEKKTSPWTRAIKQVACKSSKNPD
ncbi:unnamed protein product [Rhodiola kirilowii]